MLCASNKGVNSLNRYLLLAIGVVLLGSASQHGYNLRVIDAPLELMGDWLNSTNYNRTGEYLTETSIKMIFFSVEFSYYIGLILGGVCADVLSERLGRKGGLLVNNVFPIVAAIFFGFCKLAESWVMVLVGRLLTGVNTGLNARLGRMYLSEIAPKELQENIGTWYQIAVAFSFLLSQLLSLDCLLGTSSHWPILLALTAGPAILQLFMLLFCPESPRHLINQGKDIEAQRALSWLRDTSDVHDEMEEMRSEAEAQTQGPAVSLRDKLTEAAVLLLIHFTLKLAEYIELPAVMGPYGYLVFKVLLLVFLVVGIKMMRKNWCHKIGEIKHTLSRVVVV